MSQTLYITTANYATRVAQQANATATSLNTIVSSLDISNLFQISIASNAIAQNAYSTAVNANVIAQNANNLSAQALSNAIIANTIAFIALSNAQQANTNAQQAYPVAILANTIAQNAYPIALLANTIAQNAYPVAILANTIAQNANNLSAWALSNAQQANTIAFIALSNAQQANTIAQNAYPIALLANTIAQQAYPVAILANTIAQNAYPVALLANTIAQQAYPVALLANTVAQNANNLSAQALSNAQQANTIAFIALSNAQQANTIAFIALSNAQQAYPVAILANIVANQANITAVSTNNFVTTINAAATYIYSVFANVISSGFNPIWSNIGGNVYTFQNVGIGTANPTNTLDVVGNVHITGNVIVDGYLQYGIESLGTVMSINSPLLVSSPSTTNNEIIINPFNWVKRGYLVSNTVDGGITFAREGLYNILLNVQGLDKDSEYDRLGTINVYTSASNFSSATQIYGDSAWSAYGPPTHNITVPLNVTNRSNVYYLAYNFFRNNFPYTVTTRSFVEITPLIPVGIPVFPNVATSITQSTGNPYIGINQTNPLYNLDVGGDINYSGDVYRDGQLLFYGSGGSLSINSNVAIGTFITSSNALNVIGDAYISGNLVTNVSRCTGLPDFTFSNGTSNVYYLGNVGIGTSSVSNALDVIGNVYIGGGGFLFANISKCTGAPVTVNPWNVGTGNVYYTGNVDVTGNITATRLFANVTGCPGVPPISTGTGNVFYFGNVGIGTSNVSNALDIVGNVFISGRLSAEQVFMVACSDESSPLQVSSPAITFRTPYNWILTKPPRATLASVPTTNSVNVMVQVESSNILVNELQIPVSTYSSRLTPPTLSRTYIPDDSNVIVNITQTDPTASGLKLLFYYMVV